MGPVSWHLVGTRTLVVSGVDNFWGPYGGTWVVIQTLFSLNVTGTRV